jgi:predicted dehydrogenase
MMAFHLNWLTWIFGPVADVSCFRGKVSKLDPDIDDLYQCLMRFTSGVTGTVMVDVVARFATRLTRCYSDEGVVVWDHDLRRVQVWSARDRAWKEYREPEVRTEPGYLFAEDPYTDEMSHFINAVRGEEKYGYTLSEDRDILRIVRAAELSSDRGAVVRMPA